MSFQNMKKNFLNLFQGCRGGKMIDTDQPEGTIKDFFKFDVKADCEIIREVIMGEQNPQEGANKITDIVAARTNAQRQELKLEYAELYENTDLEEDLKSTFKGQFVDVLLAMFVYPSVLDAWALHAAIKEDTSPNNVNALLDIIFTKCNEEIIQITDAYETLYDKKLAAQVDKRTETCYLSKLFYSLCFANNESKVVVARHEHENDDAKAKRAAEMLLGERKWGSFDSYFYKLLYQRGFQQLDFIFKEYEKQAAKSVEESIKESGLDADLEKTLLSIVKCVCERYVYFADRLYECVQGVGTKDTELIQIIVSRSEVDLVQIKEAFQLKYGRSLEDCIAEGITRGGGELAENYKNVMVKLCTGNNNRVTQNVLMKSCMSPQVPV